MAIRSRWFLGFLAALAAAVLLVPVGGAARAVAPPRYATLYFLYTTNCTFTVQDDSGSPVTSFPPGTYNVDVRTPVAFNAVPLNLSGPGDMTDCRGLAQFQLTGPGVNLATSVYGGCLTDEEFLETFQPGATYTAQDNNQPSVTRTVLTTLTSGSPVVPTSSSTSPGTGTQSTDLVGSKVLPFRGTLDATVGKNGLPALTRKGKAVRTLAAGQYTFVVTDLDSKASFTVQSAKLKLHHLLTSGKFVGTHRVKVALEAGVWTYSGGGAVHSFTVTS